MALFTPSAFSPAVTVKEIDLTGVVPNVQTSTGAFVGNFGWGRRREVTLVSDESGLVSRFSAPTTDNTVDFHSKHISCVILTHCKSFVSKIPMLANAYFASDSAGGSLSASTE